MFTSQRNKVRFLVFGSSNARRKSLYQIFKNEWLRSTRLEKQLLSQVFVAKNCAVEDLIKLFVDDHYEFIRASVPKDHHTQTSEAIHGIILLLESRKDEDEIRKIEAYLTFIQENIEPQNYSEKAYKIPVQILVPSAEREFYKTRLSQMLFSSTKINGKFMEYSKENLILKDCRDFFMNYLQEAVKDISPFPLLKHRGN